MGKKTTFSINDVGMLPITMLKSSRTVISCTKVKSNDVTVISRIVKLIEEHKRGENFTKFIWVLDVVSQTIDNSNRDKRDPSNQGNNLQNRGNPQSKSAYTRAISECIRTDMVQQTPSSIIWQVRIVSSKPAWPML